MSVRLIAISPTERNGKLRLKAGHQENGRLLVPPAPAAQLTITYARCPRKFCFISYLSRTKCLVGHLHNISNCHSLGKWASWRVKQLSVIQTLYTTFTTLLAMRLFTRVLRCVSNIYSKLHTVSRLCPKQRYTFKTGTHFCVVFSKRWYKLIYFI